MNNEPWPRVEGNHGILCWDTPWGRAYATQCPPSNPPLTAVEVQALPNGKILVLWGGGNGPHEYIWHNGRVFNGKDDVVNGGGTKLGGRIGSWSLVGHKPCQDKVWAISPEAKAQTIC